MMSSGTHETGDDDETGTTLRIRFLHKVFGSRIYFMVAESALLLAVSAAQIGQAQNQQDIETQLNSIYGGKVLIFREFHEGGTLKYDVDGKLAKGGAIGPWTLDANIEVKRMRLSAKGLEVDGDRISKVYNETMRAFQNLRGARVKVQIELQQPPTDTQSAQTLLAKIFLSRQETILDVAPDYWKPFLRAMSGGGSSPPGTDDLEAYHRHLPDATSPVPVRKPEPPYTEEARVAGLQGIVRLGAVVDKQGRVTDVWIVKPLGLGLDDQAARAVQKWKFKPATRSGVPMSVRVLIETSFHL